MSDEERNRRMRRNAGDRDRATSGGRSDGGDRSRKSLPVETIPLTPEDVENFDGEVLMGQVADESVPPTDPDAGTGQATSGAGAPDASASASRDGQGHREPRRKGWVPQDPQQRQQGVWIDRSVGVGWRRMSEEELRENLLAAQLEAETSVHWYEHLVEVDGRQPGRVKPGALNAAKEAMLDRNAQTGRASVLGQAYGLRFGDLPEDEIHQQVDERVQQLRAQWADGDVVDQPYLRRHQARGMFGSTARERARQQHQQAQESLQRADLMGRAGLSERDHMRLLRMNSRLAAEEYMSSLRDSDILVPGFSQAQREQKLTTQQKVYARMMMLTAVRPLSQGVNAASVVQAISAMTTMLILSKDFRSEMGEQYAKPLKDGLEAHIERRARQHGTRAEWMANTFNKTTGADGLQVDRNTFLSKKWRGRLEDLERRDRGHRDLYTVETAAMTEIGLTENAYRLMREGDPKDNAEIMRSYQAMHRRLHDQIGEDGLDPTEVSMVTKTILGRRMETEPELAVMFNGMAYGRIVRSPAHEERIKGSDHVRAAWTGEFEDHLGKKVPPQMMFTLRPPLGADHHQASIARVMQERMLHGMETEGMAGFNNSFAGYMLGHVAAEENWVKGPDSSIDTSTMTPQNRVHLEQCEKMLTTMMADGLDESERRRIYSNAYVDAIESVRATYPDFAKDWDRAFGATWQDSMRQAAADPRSAMALQASQILSTRFSSSYGKPESESSAAWPSDDQWAASRDADDHQPV